MRRRLATITICLATAGLVGGFHEWGTARAATSSCGNTFQNDGHSGPWRTLNNGGTLHGNAIDISCPTQSTHWDIDYYVQRSNNGVGPWTTEIHVHQTGNGDQSLGASESPFPCTGADVFRTHVVNNVTGGTINKPGGQAGVVLCP